MPKTKAVESKDNEVIKKLTTKKLKNTNKEMVEKVEPNKLVAKTEKKVKAPVQITIGCWNENLKNPSSPKVSSI